jgi:uncharacterized protein (TIGR03435 family)
MSSVSNGSRGPQVGATASVLIGTVVVVALSAGAQSPTPTSTPVTKPTFEVASVKERTEPLARLVNPQGIRPGGQFSMLNSPLVRLVMYAYDLRDYQVIADEGWFRQTRFDVEARAGREVGTPEARLMLRALLEERFGLIVHSERREMPLYRLILDRRDGQLGPAMNRSDDKCQRMVQRPADAPARGAVVLTGCSDMSSFARSSAARMQAPVIDETGLTGLFEYAMYYAGVAPDGSPLAEPVASADLKLPAYTTALREQLGLRLERSSGPLEVLIIDAANRPTAN